MAFIDPSSVFITWGTFTVPAGTTTMTITHGASFTPERVILFPKDAYAWSSAAIAYNYTGTTFDIVLTAQQNGDAAFEFVVGKN